LLALFADAPHGDPPAVEPQEANVETPAEAVEEPTPNDQLRPSYYWTWRLLRAGFSPKECSAIRDLPAEAVLNHALQAADDELRIDAAWFLTREHISRIDRALGDGESSGAGEVLDRLADGTQVEQVQLVRKARPST
jgi:hypothetical protein